MIYKIIGSLAVLVSAAMLAARTSSAMREGVAQTEAFILLVRRVREEISCFRTPRERILAAHSSEVLLRAGIDLSGTGGDLYAALLAARPRLYIEGEAYRALLAFSSRLGEGYAEEELARCDLCLFALDRSLEEGRLRLPRAAKLSRTLALGSALAVIILLV